MKCTVTILTDERNESTDPYRKRCFPHRYSHSTKHWLVKQALNPVFSPFLMNRHSGQHTAQTSEPSTESSIMFTQLYLLSDFLLMKNPVNLFVATHQQGLLSGSHNVSQIYCCLPGIQPNEQLCAQFRCSYNFVYNSYAA